MINCRWASTDRHVLTVSDCKLRLTIWSLTDKSVQFIQYPKHADRGVDFSPDGKLMAVLQRPSIDMIDEMGSQGDMIGIYLARSVGKWTCLHQIALESAETEDVKFSRDG